MEPVPANGCFPELGQPGTEIRTVVFLAAGACGGMRRGDGYYHYAGGRHDRVGRCVAWAGTLVLGTQAFKLGHW